jgi:small ligand-binding sensory domain FIST
VLSSHPVAANAAGEVIGEALELVGMHPDIALLLVTGTHTRFLRELASAVQSTLAPRVLVSIAAAGIAGGGHEVIGGDGVVLWAASLGSVRTIVWQSTPPSVAEFGAAPNAVVVLADEAGSSTGPALNRWAAAMPHTEFLGGTISPGQRIVVGDQSVRGVAVLIDDAPVSMICVPRTKPVSPALLVSRVHGSAVLELNDEPAITQIERLIASVAPPDREHLRRGIYAGVHTAGSGFTTTKVLGMQRHSGAIVLDHPADVGAAVDLRVLDDDSAGQALLSETFADARLPVGCLSFFDLPTLVPHVLDDDNDVNSLAQWMSCHPAGVLTSTLLGRLDGTVRTQRFALSALIFR